jgi:lipopolysaccharide/colanic/teichoic acid biosynthesis glycosyltransferase
MLEMEGSEVLGQNVTQMPVEVAALDGASLTFDRERVSRRYHKMIRPGAGVHPRPSHTFGATNPRPSTWQRFWGEWLLAPFFLCSSLAVILLVPEKLVKKITAPFSGINWWEQIGKRVFDFVMALLGFAMTSVLFFVVPFFIKMDSSGPVFYGQQRVGLNHRRRERRVVSLAVPHERRRGERRSSDVYGRPFTVYKFRTMRSDAEKHSGAVWAQKNDPRITRSGNILRFTHVDEIPQFLNVLLGEMSMVGPRPERPQIIPKLVEQIPDYARRLDVKPGMSGIAQIYCGYDASIDDVREKLRYDLMYVQNHSLKYDVMILFKTLWMIIRGRERAD